MVRDPGVSRFQWDKMEAGSDILLQTSITLEVLKLEGMGYLLDWMDL